MSSLVSIIIPVYNEAKVIENCLKSLLSQSYKPMEIILVDDGSNDKTFEIISNFNPSSTESKRGREFQIPTSPTSRLNFQLLRQKHQGPGSARNLGASKARGEILVFADSDMTFDKNFTRDLVQPILEGKTIGTFSKNEKVSNYNNPWSICWNINRNVPYNRMLAVDYPNEAPVFRAILKREFEKVGGFDTNGEYTDDWSLSRKLGVKSTLAKGAIYYHANPSTLQEVFKQACWIGKNEFISGNIVRRIRSLILYSLPISLIIGILKSISKWKLLARRNFSEVGSFVVFKLVYDLGVFISVVKSFVMETKYK